jgi:hypothetical protein
VRAPLQNRLDGRHRVRLRLGVNAVRQQGALHGRHQEHGVAGTVAYVLTELAFLLVAFPVAAYALYQATGHWSDIVNNNADRAAAPAVLDKADRRLAVGGLPGAIHQALLVQSRPYSEPTALSFRAGGEGMRDRSEKEVRPRWNAYPRHFSSPCLSGVSGTHAAQCVPVTSGEKDADRQLFAHRQLFRRSTAFSPAGSCLLNSGFSFSPSLQPTNRCVESPAEMW